MIMQRSALMNVAAGEALPEKCAVHAHTVLRLHLFARVRL